MRDGEIPENIAPLLLIESVVLDKFHDGIRVAVWERVAVFKSLKGPLTDIAEVIGHFLDGFSGPYAQLMEELPKHRRSVDFPLLQVLSVPFVSLQSEKLIQGVYCRQFVLFSSSEEHVIQCSLFDSGELSDELFPIAVVLDVFFEFLCKK